MLVYKKRYEKTQKGIAGIFLFCLSFVAARVPLLYAHAKWHKTRYWRIYTQQGQVLSLCMLVSNIPSDRNDEVRRCISTYRYHLSKNASLYLFQRSIVIKYYEKLLVSATVTEVTARRAIQLVDKVRTTVSYLDVGGYHTTF